MAHIHFIGIGGAGLSAIATVLLQQQHTVSGSDMQNSAMVERLRRLGAIVNIGHCPENLTTPDVVVISSAVAADNPEVAAARARHIPVIKRPAWLGQMMTGKRGITIAGTHGKTTTTAMIALILSRANFQPTYIVGGFIPQLNSNAAAGNSDWLVIEADEYDHTFLSLKPEIAVITNVEWDHPDIYPTAADYTAAFADFIRLVPPHGQTILCGDDEGAKNLAAIALNTLTYGLNHNNTVQAINLQPNYQGGFTFTVAENGVPLTIPPIALQIPGLHNVQNALAALIAAQIAGVDPAQAAQTLSEFSGTGRRFELKGEINGITIIDDYAHHPGEIRATLAAARSRFGNRPLWAVFQPHTFSRTLTLLDDFAAAFTAADHLILLDIFASREKDDGSISSATLLAKITHPDARHIPTITEAAAYLQTRLAPGDVLITLGAGDGYRVGEQLLTEGVKHDD